MNKEKTNFISKRHNTRLLAVCIMYDIDLNSFINDEHDKEIIIKQALEDVLLMNQEEFLSDELDKFYDPSFLSSLVNMCYLNLQKVDDLIIKSLINWSLDRLSYVDRAIIRIATSEMLMNESSKSIIINEAIEMTKDLSVVENNNQVRFNNRLLENIARNVYGD